MKQKHHSTEEIIRILRQADTDQTVESVCRDGGGRLRWIGALTDPASARRYLQGVGPTPPLPLIPLEPHPARVGLRRLTQYSIVHRSRSLSTSDGVRLEVRLLPAP
ncbi:MAG TPA: hypothetical protein EYG11_05125 [Candidatus Latescibacteria bacterium]|nr:hypothetical protein [Candidatus Handelsmanbacteria bacterium]HIL08062.1 hypothetical protein [Candidatus Latescibacterota bacterium]